MRRRNAVYQPIVGLVFAFLMIGVIGAGPVPAQAPPPFKHVDGAVTGPIIESSEALRVTTTIQCWCGGCSNQTLHECTCSLAASERQKVADALASGKTPEALIAAYVADHGPQVRIVPEKRGWDLIGWAVPFAVTLVALLCLTLVLITWNRRGIAATVSGGETRRAAASPADRIYRERLERDLKELE